MATHPIHHPPVARDRAPELDALVADAAAIAGVPVAYLGFLEGGAEWIRATRGWNRPSVPLAQSFAARIREARDVVVIADATRDARLADHPLVTGAPNIRFYAGAPILDPNGNFAGALSVMDRAPRTLNEGQLAGLRALAKVVMRELRVRDLEEAVAEADDRFRDFFEHTDDLIMSIGPDGRLLHANQAVANALGYSREELASAPLVRLMDAEARDGFRAAFAAAFSTREAQRVETVFVTSGGRRITVEGSLRPRLVDGHPVLARVTFRDITDRKEFESELGNARDAALEAARLKTQFLTNVSHEIRTPMNGIVGMIDLLMASPLSAEQQDFAYQARANADQLLAIVNNILYVSHVQAGSLAAANVDFDLYRTLQRVVEVMKIAALGKELDVSFVFDEQLPPIFRGHQARIRQVVTNLMDNAVKFTEEGTVVLRVRLQTETETHRVVRFEVRDSGIGIAEEDRLLLFERFSQVEATSTRRFGGIGLGLATARQLVEMMGGLMDVDSTPGVGSTFWFTIPFPKLVSSRKPIGSSDLEFKGKRVLLSDPLPTSRRIVHHYLALTWEMRVDVAETESEALAMLRRAAELGDPYRVVVADLDAAAFPRGTSFVQLVASNGRVNDEAMREAGVAAYVMKPVGQGELFDAMTVALAGDALPLARAAGQPYDSRMPPPPVPLEKRKSIRVLLAEDNFLNRKLTLSQLEKLGYPVDSVANGKEALEALQKRDYEIILMDCQMPVLDGYQATMDIRRSEAVRHRIIAMTANALEGDREKCLAAGMDDYLAKPTKADELETALARYFAV
ncbi:MAG TPA: response regulator [Thermoanaerobaculia bacterium]|jgi:PAS domain S-box-containing protein|nr:response regulator [Thermoanaerobaculia bacterium]